MTPDKPSKRADKRTLLAAGAGAIALLAVLMLWGNGRQDATVPNPDNPGVASAAATR